MGVAPLDTKLSPGDTAGALFIVEAAGGADPSDSNAAQRWGGPPLHVHLEQDEWWYILEGQQHFLVGNIHAPERVVRLATCAHLGVERG